ncbi:PRC-barrel domain-containing protein [Sphingomonas montana]|uniref:PRC-barrel domain-containing protein n=1 Tax=Sphingomonas montana TaxID=1843236 RepID=UPI001F0AB903|nr:PRC-barrel domain-containing protein [Sphingomonas montana]
MVEDIAGWIAPIATMVAAMMTAANLGTRTTGWGFVVFTVGSIAWIVVATASGQSNLLLSNAFLTAVNLVGIWRWLGHRARVEDSASAAIARSRADGAVPVLLAATTLQGRAVKGQDGAVVATAVEAMADCRDGRIDYLIVSVGGLAGVGETLHRLPWRRVTVHDDGLATDLTPDDARALAGAEA